MTGIGEVRFAWISAARAGFNARKRMPCFICGKFRYVAEAHHVVPLSSQFDRGFKGPDHEHEWLCPTHHAIIHALIDGSPDEQKLGRRAAPIIVDLDRDELARMLDLVARSARWPV
jgi:hypothetical protein